MKFANIIKTSILGAAVIAAVGCNDAEYGTIDNRVYISEASPAGLSHQQIENLTISGELQTSIHVRLVKAIDRDVNVKIGFAPEFLEEYNATYQTSYAVIPDEYIELDREAVIKAGDLASDNINIKILPYPTDNGEAYCVPLKITDCDAPFGVAGKAGRIIYILSAPHKQVVPSFNYQPSPSAEGDWGVETTEWTLEAWVYMSSFLINNQAIMSASIPDNAHGTEIYIRFGDADVPYNVLQIKTGGTQFETNTVFNPYTWYHLAFTYANDLATIYVNGVVDNQKSISVSQYIINNLSLCSSGSQYFKAQARMAQVRFWKKALSQNAIQDAMNRQVPSDSDGLIGYWKLDEGQGSTLYDSSPNERHMTCATTPTWITTEVDFSNPNGN